jgi:predicted nucleotidyltransferase
MSIIKSLHKDGKLQLSKDFLTDIVFEAVGGSQAYLASNNASDMDINGICMLPLDMAFPHRIGFIKGFGPAPDYFETMNQHHIQHNDKEYDVAILSIVKFFSLAAENNPNIVDILFSPERCVLAQTEVGRHMRTNRHQFLHKGSMQKFLGYAHSQFKKIETKGPTGKRKELVEKYSYDTKYLGHLFRLCLECEQILTEGDLNLEKNGDIIKSVRNGMYTLEEAKVWFKEKELSLQKLYVESKLPHTPDWSYLRTLLIQCFEIRYGSINEMNHEVLAYRERLEQIKKLTEM